MRPVISAKTTWPRQFSRRPARTRNHTAHIRAPRPCPRRRSLLRFSGPQMPPARGIARDLARKAAPPPRGTSNPPPLACPGEQRGEAAGRWLAEAQAAPPTHGRILSNTDGRGSASTRSWSRADRRILSGKWRVGLTQSVRLGSMPRLIGSLALLLSGCGQVYPVRAIDVHRRRARVIGRRTGRRQRRERSRRPGGSLRRAGVVLPVRRTTAGRAAATAMAASSTGRKLRASGVKCHEMRATRGITKPGDLGARGQRDLGGQRDPAASRQQHRAPMLRRISDDRNDHERDKELRQVRRVGEGSQRADERFADEGGSDRRNAEDHKGGRKRPAGSSARHDWGQAARP